MRRNHTAALTIAMAVPDLGAAAIGAVSIVIGLAVINPLLVPITIVSAIPLWIVGRGGSDEMYLGTSDRRPRRRLQP